MAKPRNRGSKPINTEYLGSFILARFRGSKSKFAEEAEVGRTTIYNALAGKPVDQLTIDRFCRADPALDYVRLTTIPDQVPQATVSSGDDTNSRPPTILTLASIKGGAGKTMIAVSIAAELATKLRVALVDVDVFTFGATRWFGELVRSAQSPLTFVDVALRADAAQSRSVLKTEVEQPIPAQSAGELLFVPAHCEVCDKTFGVAT